MARNAAGSARTLAAGVLLAFMVSASVRGGVPLWLMTVAPLTTTQGQPTTFAVTISSLSLSGFRCVRLDVTDAFSLTWVAITGKPLGSTWQASLDGTQIEVGGSSALITGQSIAVDVRATALTAGLVTWTATAHAAADCSGSAYGLPTTALITVAPVLIPTPTPSASPTPAISPSEIPTPPPTPTASASASASGATPTPVPSPTPRSSPTPAPATTPAASEAAVTPPPADETPRADASPAADQSTIGPEASPRADGSAPGGVPATPAPVALGPGGLGVRTEGPGADLVAGVGPTVVGVQWIVPVAVLGVPGLLIALWLALQVVVGAVWLPLAYRMGRDRGRARRRVVLR